MSLFIFHQFSFPIPEFRPTFLHQLKEGCGTLWPRSSKAAKMGSFPPYNRNVIALVLWLALKQVSSVMKSVGYKLIQGSKGIKQQSPQSFMTKPV